MIRLSLAVAMAMCVLATVTAAGECVDGDGEYTAVLERGPGSEGFDYAISCLGKNPIVWGRYWAGPNAAAAFAILRADTLKPRLSKVLPKLLGTSWADSADHRFVLYSIAARRGISRIESIDVFDALVNSRFEQSDWKTIYEDIAILQDCRAVDLLRQRYQDLRAYPDRGYEEEILDVPSCLYHIPCKEAVSTARTLEAKETDPRLRERLRRVVDRE